MKLYYAGVRLAGDRLANAFEDDKHENMQAFAYKSKYCIIGMAYEVVEKQKGWTISEIRNKEREIELIPDQAWIEQNTLEDAKNRATHQQIRRDAKAAEDGKQASKFENRTLAECKQLYKDGKLSRRSLEFIFCNVVFNDGPRF